MAKSAIFWQNSQFGTSTKKGWYWYPLDRDKVVLVLIKVILIPIHQKRVGIGTDQSSTGTDTSNRPDFCTFALLSPKFVHR